MHLLMLNFFGGGAIVNSKRMICFAALLVLAAVDPVARAQAPADSGVIRTETKLVLVDTVVTDKKGNYVRDLTAKEFKVWEDGKEQTIKSFSSESDPASGPNQKHYLVLLFDNSTMDYGDQARARDAAAKFIQSNGGPNRLMAIANFGGALQIAQNFTDDTERLKNVVNGVKFSAVAPNAADANAPQLSTQMASFGARDLLYALTDLAKGLSSVPGRKTVILITAGFPLTPEIMSEATAVISACNRSNVAIYPIDVRGLVAGGPVASFTAPNSGVRFIAAAYQPGGMSFFIPQHGGGGAGGGGAGGGGAGGGGAGGGAGGGHSGGSGGTGGSPGHGTSGTNGTTGTRGPAGGTNPLNPCAGNSPMAGGGGTSSISPGSSPGCQSRQVIPQLPEGTTTNQNIMYMLAGGTGGFVIHETNDLIGGMEKIGKDQNEYYLLGYTPPESEEGSCHVLKVKVDRSGTEVRARTGYCNSRPQDLLAGNSTEKTLEARAVASQAGDVSGSMQLPFFYTSPNVARVNVAMEIATGDLKFEKVKGKFHAAINVLGLAYLPDGSVGARFSDTLNLDFEDKKQAEAFKEKPMHYENQFDVASGKYNLKVVYSSGGQSFGKLEMPLAVDPYDAKQFSMSALALSKEARKASDLGTSLDALLLADRVPLIADGIQLVPYGSNHFKKTDLAAFYMELYEPLLVTGDPKTPPVVAFQLRVLDGKTGEQKEDTGLLRVGLPAQKGNPTIPVAARIPTTSLTPGPYKVEIKAMDDAGKEFKRTTDIQIE
jgi:VWFA-related protein